MSHVWDPRIHRKDRIPNVTIYVRVGEQVRTARTSEKHRNFMDVLAMNNVITYSSSLMLAGN